MTKEITKTDTKIIEEIPDFSKGIAGVRGNENVTANDITIPRIKLVQGLSPEKSKNNTKYIEGISEGMIFNSVSNKIYGDEIIFCPASFETQFLIFKDRLSGGGFYGAFKTVDDAKKELQIVAQKDKCDASLFQINETANHYGVLRDSKGVMEDVCISFTSTGLKTSRQLNTLVHLTGRDRFAGKYLFKALLTSNHKGEFYNFKITPNGPSEEMYPRAEKLYYTSLQGLAKASSENIEDTSDEKVPY